MTGYAPSWLFGAFAIVALIGVFACTVSVILRPVMTGIVCQLGRPGPESRSFLVFLAVGLVATTFRMLGA